MHQLQIKIYTPQELNHSSYVQTGLFELEKEGFLKTHVKISLAKRLGTLRIENSKIIEISQPHPKTSFYELNDLKTGKKIRFATDLYDASTSFSMYALEHCDFVFKRNFDVNTIKKLPQKYQDKLFPLGLTFKVDSSNRKEKIKFFIGILFSNILINLKFDRYFYMRLKKEIGKQIKHWKQFVTTNNINFFENKLVCSSENSILFQTRCFEIENQRDVQQIHQQRHKIILILKARYGLQFKGGFIPSELARSKYGNALTDLPTDPLSYLELVKNSKIVIYTRGLVNSPAWKMAEYLSQGKVIVAEKITSELPEPIVHEQELMFFENDNEMIQIIENLLTNPTLCEKLSFNSRKYFDSNVHPKVRLKRMINFMILQKIQ